MRPLLLFALVAAAFVAGYWTLVFLYQRALLFPAPRIAGAPLRPADAETVWLDIPSGRVEAWFLPATEGARGPRPLLLFLHGNGELIDFWPTAFDVPRRRGAAVLLLEYPGYGRSTGRPAQTTITQAVLAAHDWALTRPDVDRARMVAYGRSVGGGAACQLALRRPLAALVLESSFTSVRSFARAFGAPGFLVRDPFDNLAAVRRYRGPLLLLHGGRDDIIPPEHSRALLAASPQAELHLLPCGHNDCPREWPLVLDFLARHEILAAPRS